MTIAKTPCYFFGMTGDYSPTHINHLDGRVADPKQFEAFMTARIQAACKVGERRFVLHMPQGATGDCPYVANCWTCLLPHVRNYFRDQKHLAASTGYAVSWELYTGPHIDKSLPTNLSVSSENINFLTAPYLTDDNRAMIIEREWMPWVMECGFKGFIIDATGSQQATVFKEISKNWKISVTVLTEAHNITNIGSDPEGPGGVKYNLDVRNDVGIASIAVSAFHTVFDRMARWVVPNPKSATLIRHTIVYEALNEAQLTSLHNRGFILGIWSGTIGLDENLVRKVRSKARTNLYVPAVADWGTTV